MKTIPTAEEFLTQNFEGSSINPNILIEFAKLHVTEALRQASENAKMQKFLIDEDFIEIIDRLTILNAYSLDNIK